MSWLINASQLDKIRKSQKNITILDATWNLTSGGTDAKEAFLKRRIAGAQFFNLDHFYDYATQLPAMLIRDEVAIKEKISALGISEDHKIIFYDHSDIYTSCRALWMFKVFGHHPSQLHILNGGYQAWERYGGKIESGEPRTITAKDYQVRFQAQYIRTLVQMKTNLHHPAEQVIDMRHPVRYAGGQESRLGLRSGHIPQSFSFPYFTMFESDGRWKPIEKIRKQLVGIGVDLNDPIVTTCGSGTTAAILNFALDLMDHTAHALYDGSWSEWGTDQLYPGEESLAERPVQTSLEK
jgi:thiosulfate/3-mercaptopyruvate sulfurtransferase